MNITCPFCNHKITVTAANSHDYWFELNIPKTSYDKDLGFGVTAITCLNDECKQLILKARLTDVFYIQYTRSSGESEVQKEWDLIPEYKYIQFPDYIPPVILEDYSEACKIIKLSPKASATLSRRCLQGMIRDFWKIKKDTLFLEVDALKEVMPDKSLWDAIDSIRKLGNIGAHMEKDVNVIVEISENEAQDLINLIELLLKEWYVSRHNRDESIKKVKLLAGIKTEQRKFSSTKE